MLLIIILLSIVLAAVSVLYYQLGKQYTTISNRNECLEELLKGRNAEIATLEERCKKLHQDYISCNDSWMKQHKTHQEVVKIQQETMKDLQAAMAMNRAINKVLQEENKVNKHLRTTIDKIEKLKNNIKIQHNSN